MASVNKVILLGRLGRDPETRYASEGGTAICHLALATSRRYKDRDGNRKEDTEWHNVVVFGRQAEIAQQYLRKGSEADIEGRLRTRKYTGKDGIERYSTEVVCESLQLGARPTGSAGSSDASDEFESPQRAPRAAAPTAPAPKPQQPSAPDVDSSFAGDDIPF